MSKKIYENEKKTDQETKNNDEDNVVFASITLESGQIMITKMQPIPINNSYSKI